MSVQPQPQPELPLFLIKRDNVNVQWLIDTLRLRGWMTRKEILKYAGLPESDRNVRWVRALVEAAGDEIVKGQKGFNDPRNCTVEEITDAANQSISQGKAMLRYGIKLRRHAHALVGGAPK